MPYLKNKKNGCTEDKRSLKGFHPRSPSLTHTQLVLPSFSSNLTSAPGQPVNGAHSWMFFNLKGQSINPVKLSCIVAILNLLQKPKLNLDERNKTFTYLTYIIRLKIVCFFELGCAKRLEEVLKYEIEKRFHKCIVLI